MHNAQKKLPILLELFKATFTLSAFTFGGGFIIVSLMKKKFVGENKIIAIALQVMRAGVAAVIFDVVIKLAENICKTRRILYIGLMILSFIATYFLNISAMMIILLCLIIGILDVCYTLHKKDGDLHA